LLVVDDKFRGIGIGRQLLERHLEHARMKGVGVISVYTTDPGCNWGFYEAYGFKKAVEFDDDIGSYLEGVRSKGLIFTLDLRK
jgi:GNAT superfamily N-acetyltransferase